MAKTILTHTVCGGKVKWLVPPKLWEKPHYQCQKCGCSVISYMIKEKKLTNQQNSKKIKI